MPLLILEVLVSVGVADPRDVRHEAIRTAELFG